MVRKTKEEAEITRKAIIEAALDVFYQKGYSRTTFDDIAGKINLTKGAVYWHFKNKAELLEEIIKEKFYHNHVKRLGLLPEVKNLGDLRDALVKNAELIKNDAAYRKFLFFMLFQMEWSEAMVNKIGDSIREIRDFPLIQLKEALTIVKNNGELAPGADIEELALVLLHLWKGALGDEIGRFTKVDFPTMVGRSVDMIFDGFRKERS